MKELILGGYLLFLAQYLTLTGANPVGSCPLTNGQYDVLLPDDEYCHFFYKCNWGTPIRIDCYGDLYFDYKLNVCNYPKQAECYNQNNGSGGGEGPGEGGDGSGGNSGGESGEDSGESWDKSCTNDIAQMYYPDIEDCQSYYICTYGTLHHMLCPPGTLYNAAILVCDHPGNVRCSEKPVIVDPEPIDPDGGDGNGGDGGTGGEDGGDSGESWTDACTLGSTQVYYPDPEDCQGFYMCEFGTLTHIYCPNGTLYNAALLVCDHPENVRCSQSPEIVDPEPIDPDGGNNGGEDGGDGSGDGGDGGSGGDNGGGSGESWTDACTLGSTQIYYPDPEDCQGFYMCEFGYLKHVSCPEGTLYNAALLVCDHPYNVRCSQLPELVDPEPLR